MYVKHCEVESRVEFFKVDIQETIKLHKTIKKWAYILHDKDDTAPHYHIYLNFGNSGVDMNEVANWFGLPVTQVNKIKGRATDMYLYLTHANDSQTNKHQYLTSEIVANFDIVTEIENSKILGDFEHFSYAEQLDYVYSLPLSERVTAFNKLEKAWQIRCRWLSSHGGRKMDVVFICGKAGTGKTSYAKKLLQSMDLDFCISSSSNDPFQDYLGQKGMILDDLRDNAFEFVDLLKVLDNDTSSSARSRFVNKVFTVEVLVITSSVPLKFWYPKIRYSSFDTMDQLYRRIGCYVVITDDEITVYNDGLTEKGEPKGLGRVFKNELSGLKREKRDKTDFNSVFEKICENSPLEIGEVIPRQTIMNLK